MAEVQRSVQKIKEKQTPEQPRPFGSLLCPIKELFSYHYFLASDDVDALGQPFQRGYPVAHLAALRVVDVEGAVGRELGNGAGHGDRQLALSFGKFEEGKSCILRTAKADLFERYLFIKDNLSKVTRLNIVITDIESFKEEDFERYKQIIETLSWCLEKLYADGQSPQLNILTDHMMLPTMNNCGAGDTNITLAPNGKFYADHRDGSGDYLWLRF